MDVRAIRGLVGGRIGSLLGCFSRTGAGPCTAEGSVFHARSLASGPAGRGLYVTASDGGNATRSSRSARIRRRERSPASSETASTPHLERATVPARSPGTALAESWNRCLCHQRSPTGGVITTHGLTHDGTLLSDLGCVSLPALGGCGTSVGVRSVSVGVLRLAGGAHSARRRRTCLYLTSRGRLTRLRAGKRGACTSSHLLRGSGTTHLSLKLRRPLARGAYIIYSRAVSRNAPRSGSGCGAARTWHASRSRDRRLIIN